MNKLSLFSGLWLWRWSGWWGSGSESQERWWSRRREEEGISEAVGEEGEGWSRISFARKEELSWEVTSWMEFQGADDELKYFMPGNWGCVNDDASSIMVCLLWYRQPHGAWELFPKAYTRYLNRQCIKFIRSSRLSSTSYPLWWTLPVSGRSKKNTFSEFIRQFPNFLRRWISLICVS